MKELPRDWIGPVYSGCVPAEYTAAVKEKEVRLEGRSGACKSQEPQIHPVRYSSARLHYLLAPGNDRSSRCAPKLR
jgi:hypothetical protein